MAPDPCLRSWLPWESLPLHSEQLEARVQSAQQRYHAKLREDERLASFINNHFVVYGVPLDCVRYDGRRLAPDGSPLRETALSVTEMYREREVVALQLWHGCRFALQHFASQSTVYLSYEMLAETIRRCLRYDYDSLFSTIYEDGYLCPRGEWMWCLTSIIEEQVAASKPLSKEKAAAPPFLPKKRNYSNRKPQKRAEKTLPLSHYVQNKKQTHTTCSARRLVLDAAHLTGGNRVK